MTATLAERVAAGERAALARAVTLVESKRADHRAQAAALLQALLPRTGNAVRIGITGVPGVGKSTLIDAFGARLAAQGHRVAVFAIDPSSARTGGSILGDKTRMARLASEPSAFVRPSPTGGNLGGVAVRTRESMLLAEAAGFDVVIVETVGVGQSETALADMVDVFVVLMLPGAGDELQGLKRGILEHADILAVNKADGENAPRARAAAVDLRAALGILAPPRAGWRVPVLTVSGFSGEGLDELWGEIRRFLDAQRDGGAFAERRATQAARWFRTLLEERLRERLNARGDEIARIEAEVRAGRLTPAAAVEALLGEAGG